MNTLVRDVYRKLRKRLDIEQERRTEIGRTRDEKR